VNGAPAWARPERPRSAVPNGFANVWNASQASAQFLMAPQPLLRETSGQDDREPGEAVFVSRLPQKPKA
jgi:hypothetical protein